LTAVVFTTGDGLTGRAHPPAETGDAFGEADVLVGLGDALCEATTVWLELADVAGALVVVAIVAETVVLVGAERVAA
jgi:hypothetical protein